MGLLQFPLTGCVRAVNVWFHDYWSQSYGMTMECCCIAPRRARSGLVRKESPMT
jgi:hypothetical protein